MVDRSGSVVAFSCFKTTPYGRGYGEVSAGVERIVTGRVPEVAPSAAERVLGKVVEVHRDGRHYTRLITNVGAKTKLLVGKPLG